MTQNPIRRSLALWLAAGLLTACSSTETEVQGTDAETTDTGTTAIRSMEIRGLVEPSDALRQAMADALADPAAADRARREPGAFLQDFAADHPSDELTWAVHRAKPRPNAGTGDFYWPSFLVGSGEPASCTIAVPDERRGAPPSSAAEAPLIEFVAMETTAAFTAADLDPESIRVERDGMGRPGLGYAMRADSSARFGDWSAARVDRAGAILIDGECVTAPRFMSRIDGPGMLSLGALPQTEIEAIAAGLKAAASAAR